MSKSKSASGRRRDGGHGKTSEAALDNYSRQRNPQHDTYWRDRGFEGRPDPSPDGKAGKPERRKR